MSENNDSVQLECKSETAAVSQKELLALLGKEKRKNPPKLLIIAAAVAVAAGIGLYSFSQNKNSDSGETVFRKYTVTRGDVTVGTTESSSISLDRETIKFPVSTTVKQIFVKEGQSVKAGDPLIQLDADEIAAGLVTYQLQVKMAQLELEQAKLDKQTKLLKAEQEYNSAVLEGELAADNQNIAITQLEKKLKDAQEDLENALEDLHTYRDYEKNYDDDYDKVSYWAAKMESYRELYTDYKDQYDKALVYADTIEAYTKKIEEEQAKSNPDDDKIADWRQKIADAESQLGGLYPEEIYQLYQSAYEQYQAAREKYTDRYADFKEDYDIEYGDDEALADKIEELEKKIEDYALQLEQAKLSQQTGTLSAEQAKALSELSAQTALAQYNLTELQLSQKVDEAQETYDQTLRQINDIEKSVSNDGIVYAPCTGMIVSINLDEGDDFDVTYDEDKDILNEVTLLTMTDISSVYVPITISEEDILNISIGQQASVTMTAFEGKTFDAEVDTISVEAARSGAATVSYTVTVRYLGENELDMYEGMSAETTLLQRQAADVLYLNNQAVTNTNGIATVTLQLEDGSTETREVKTGFSNGQFVEILQGLQEGDVVLAASGVNR